MASLRDGEPRPHIRAMPHLDRSDDEAAALIKEHNDRHPLIRTLRGILAMLRPEPQREPIAAESVCIAARNSLQKTTRGSLAHGATGNF